MSKRAMKISQTFRDVETLGRMVGFDLGFRQLDAGHPSIPATALLSENMALVHMRFARRYHQLGLPPAGKLTFGVPLGGLRDWFSRDYLESSVLPFNHPGGIDGVSENGFEAYTVSFSEDYLREIAATFQINVGELFDDPAPESVIKDGAANRRFHGMLNRLFSDPNPVMDPDSEQELIVTLLQAGQNGAAVADRSSPAVRSRALRKALEYIAESRDEAETVKAICADCNIALRTLNRAFKERFGIGPKAYLKRQDLSAVRNDLLSSPAGTQVSDIANQRGFWHMGQFAKDYRHLFGELPSQTIQN